MAHILPIKYSTDILHEEVEYFANEIYLRGHHLVKSELINVDAFYADGNKIKEDIILYVRDDIGDEIQHVINAPDEQIGIIFNNLSKSLKRAKKSKKKAK